MDGSTGVAVGVSLGVPLGVAVGVSLGVAVGVAVGVSTGVVVGVGKTPVKAKNSPVESLARIWGSPGGDPLA